MKIIVITTLIICYLLSGCAFASTGSEMVIMVENDYSVIISIKTDDVLNTQAKSIMNSGMVKEIYEKEIIEIFGSIENLSFTSSPNFKLNFKSDLVITDGNKYKIEKRDFNRILLEMETLKIELPEGYKFISSDPEPENIDVNLIIWRNMSEVPEVVFEKENNQSLNNILIVMGIVLASGILLAAGKKMIS